MRFAVAGIDPGIHGAVSIVDSEQDVADVWLLSELEKDPQMFKKIMEVHEVKHAYVEKAQAMPLQGVTAMFNYGTGFGRILGWLEMIMMPYTLIRPQTWMKEMHKGVSGPDGKTKSEVAVRRLFPTENLCLEGKRKIHSGFMDARLIAEYGKRVFK